MIVVRERGLRRAERRVEALEHLFVYASQPGRRERPLEEAADPTRALPAARNRDAAALRAGRLDRPGRDERGQLVALTQYAAGLGDLDARSVVALAPPRSQAVADHRPVADAALLDTVVAVVVGEDARP